MSLHITEISFESAGDALGHALRDGFEHSGEAAHIHFLVDKIEKVGNRWIVVVTIIAVPKKKLKEFEREERIRALDRKLDRGNLPREPREDPDEAQHVIEEKLSLKQHIEMDRHQQEVEEEYRLELQHEEERELLSHLYMRIAEEPFFRPIEPEFDFTSVHYIAEGSLWGAAKNIHPELEMYEAIHRATLESPKSPAENLKPKNDISPKPDKQPDHDMELVDE